MYPIVLPRLKIKMIKLPANQTGLNLLAGIIDQT